VNQSLFTATKIESIGDANISVTIDNPQKSLATFDAHLKGIESGIITISLHCINEKGVIEGRKDFPISGFSAQP
jgi:hypothetical protein